MDTIGRDEVDEAEQSEAELFPRTRDVLDTLAITWRRWCPDRCVKKWMSSAAP